MWDLLLLLFDQQVDAAKKCRDYPVALELYKALKEGRGKLSPSDLKTFWQLETMLEGQPLVREGRYQEALPVIRRAFAIYPEDEHTQELLAEVEAAAGVEQGLAARFQEMEELLKTAEAYDVCESVRGQVQGILDQQDSPLASGRAFVLNPDLETRAQGVKGLAETILNAHDHARGEIDLGNLPAAKESIDDLEKKWGWRPPLLQSLWDEAQRYKDRSKQADRLLVKEPGIAASEAALDTLAEVDQLTESLPSPLANGRREQAAARWRQRCRQLDDLTRAEKRLAEGVERFAGTSRAAELRADWELAQLACEIRDISPLGVHLAELPACSRAEHITRLYGRLEQLEGPGSWGTLRDAARTWSGALDDYVRAARRKQAVKILALVSLPVFVLIAVCLLIKDRGTPITDSSATATAMAAKCATAVAACEQGTLDFAVQMSAPEKAVWTSEGRAVVTVTITNTSPCALCGGELWDDPNPRHASMRLPAFEMLEPDQSQSVALDLAALEADEVTLYLIVLDPEGRPFPFAKPTVTIRVEQGEGKD